jgi:hypothetical protein
LLHSAGSGGMSRDSPGRSCQPRFLDREITPRAKRTSVEVVKFKLLSSWNDIVLYLPVEKRDNLCQPVIHLRAIVLPAERL